MTAMNYVPLSNATTPLSQSNLTENSVLSSEWPTQRMGTLAVHKHGSQWAAPLVQMTQPPPTELTDEFVFAEEIQCYGEVASIREELRRQREIMRESNNNDFAILKRTKEDDIFDKKCNLERRASTGTLNRLILVAQALESEIDSRRQTEINGGRVVFSIRTANMILLVLVNMLIMTGVGQYNSPHGGKHQLMLTADKWFYRPDAFLPITFSEMRLSGQYLAFGLSILMLAATAILQLWHLCHMKNSRLVCMCYSFGSVPFALFTFGLEMHYSACPWLDDFYRHEILRRDFNAVEPYFDTQCGISGWALAGIFSLLSCGLFVSEGLISAFFRTESFRSSRKSDALI